MGLQHVCVSRCFAILYAPAVPLSPVRSAVTLPHVQLLGRLHEARLVGLLQHLLSVAHQPAVLQHALVLLHLARATGDTQNNLAFTFIHQKLV